MTRSEKVRAQRKHKRILQHFCESSSIHGLKHVYEDGSLMFERVVWILVFLSGVCFSSYFCWQVWQKWEQSPVLTSVETQLYPLKNVPFPAVTICNVNKISESKLYEVILANPKFKNVSYTKLQSTLRFMTKLDRAFDEYNDEENQEKLLEMSQLYQARNISASDLFEILKKAAPACSDMMLDCKWLESPEPCMEYFSFLPTDDGMCCTFNGAKYLDSMLGIEANSNETREPLRVNGNGYRMGLTLVIDAKLRDFSVINGKFDGFKVLVHSPEEFPDVADRGFVLGLGTETFVGVKVTTSFYTEEVAKEVSPKKRQCLMEGEKNLKYFEYYSRSACHIECDTLLMQERCQCRPYFFKGDNETSFCEMQAYKCIAKVFEEIRLNDDDVCDCLPPCSDTWYEPEISYASFPGRGFNRTSTYKRIERKRKIGPGVDMTEYLKSNVAMLHVYYKEKTGMRYRTDIRFGAADFIASIGGLLGLGLGMSFISVIEILYYVFFRRLFLWQRVKLSRLTMRVTRILSRNTRQETKDNPRSLEVTENNNVWPSSATLSSSIATISSSSFDRQIPLTRRHSLNLPPHLQKRLSKY
ncbi:pickpocket protein 28-like [Daphnia carinata]|uniref:pickpocket protein 28-like n=1 Tax=Daphnia carinata TaxID=120202 RepID=UPI00257C241C|nr:pickpocket protein 28-like [Daphnia carinata]